MNRVFLSLGGNLNNRKANLNKACEAISKEMGAIEKRSGIYETEAWGFESKHLYLNQVLEISTDLEAEELLKKALQIEQSMGRVRIQNQVYTDRIIDIDILFYNDLITNTVNLKIPHPQLHLRNFVLQPLNEIAPEFIHPGFNKNIANLLRDCEDLQNVKPIRPLNTPKYICIEGNIGSGKSSLARVLAPYLNAEYLPEQFTEFRLLPKFYEDPKKYAFSIEFTFLLHRFEQISACFEKNPSHVVSDYSIYKSIAFAKTNLEGIEFDYFKQHFENLLPLLPVPELIIHLNTKNENLITNIKKRGREFEQSISSNYLGKIENEYHTRFAELKHIPQLHLEVERYHPQLENEHLLTIDRFLLDNFANLH